MNEACPICNRVEVHEHTAMQVAKWLAAQSKGNNSTDCPLCGKPEGEEHVHPEEDVAAFINAQAMPH